MNIKELNENAKNNQKRNLEETIKDIERSITWRASNGLNNFEVDTSGADYYYTIKGLMVEPLKEHFESEGYKVEIEEVKRFTKWIEKLLGLYSPVYLMTVSWEEV